MVEPDPDPVDRSRFKSTFTESGRPVRMVTGSKNIVLSCFHCYEIAPVSHHPAPNPPAAAADRTTEETHPTPHLLRGLCREIRL